MLILLTRGQGDGADHAAGCAVMAGPTHDIGKDERQKRIEKPATDAIQHLDGARTDRQTTCKARRAAEAQRRRAAEAACDRAHSLGLRAAPSRLWRTGRREAGFPARIGQCELLDDERQHRRVGEMEQRRGGRKHEKRPVSDKDAPTGGKPSMVGPVHFETPGLVVIDGARGDREPANYRREINGAFCEYATPTTPMKAAMKTLPARSNAAALSLSGTREAIVLLPNL